MSSVGIKYLHKNINFLIAIMPIHVLLLLIYIVLLCCVMARLCLKSGAREFIKQGRYISLTIYLIYQTGTGLGIFWVGSIVSYLIRLIISGIKNP